MVLFYEFFVIALLSICSDFSILLDLQRKKFPESLVTFSKLVPVPSYKA